MRVEVVVNQLQVGKEEAGRDNPIFKRGEYLDLPEERVKQLGNSVKIADLEVLTKRLEQQITGTGEPPDERKLTKRRRE